MSNRESKDGRLGVKTRGNQANQESAGKIVSVNRWLRVCVQRWEKGEELGFPSATGGLRLGYAIIFSREELPCVRVCVRVGFPKSS